VVLSVFITYVGDHLCFPSPTPQQEALIEIARANYLKAQSLQHRQECWPVYEFYVHRDEEDCILHVFYLPKYLSIRGSKEWFFSRTFSDIKECRTTLIQFYDSLQSLLPRIERKQLTMISTQKGGFIILDKELKLLRLLWNRLRTKRYVEIEYICSDVIIGELDDELNLYHTELNTKIQRIEKDNKQVHQIVNAYLYHRYKGDILSICEQQYEETNGGVVTEVMMLLKKIQHHTDYHQQPYFGTKKQLLAQRKTLLKTDRVLYKCLEELRRLDGWSSNTLIVRTVLNMPLVWEQYLYRNYFDVAATFSKPSMIYLEESEQENKKSEPEFVDAEAVYDAKYKRIHHLSMAKVDDNDINKLLRDMLTYNRNTGVLLYPKPMSLKEFIVFHNLSTAQRAQMYQKSMVKEARFTRFEPKKILRLEHVFFVLRD
jgi:hypothetical protein